MAPCAQIAEALANVEKASGEKSPLYQKILDLDTIKQLSAPATAADDLFAIVKSIFDQSLGVVDTRYLLNFFVCTLKELKIGDLWIDIGHRTLAILASHTSTYADSIAMIREFIADAHEASEDFEEAANTLTEVPLDSSQRQVTVKQKADIWIRIVRNYLEVDDSNAAETYINKLKNVMHQIDDTELTLHFNLSQARIWDSKRDFISASNKYHELTYSPMITDEDRLHTLSKAVKCAILAPAGPFRSRTLGRLYKDERSVQLNEFGILEKIFLDRLLSTTEVDRFAQGLQPHQLATTADGSTVLAKAVMEHNLLAVSRLYSTIQFESLASLLGLDADRAEETTARMIEQGRLVGRMDQLDGVVYFEKGEASGEKGSGRAQAIVGKEMRRWDANVENLSEEVENITNALHERFPVSLKRYLSLSDIVSLTSSSVS